MKKHRKTWKRKDVSEKLASLNFKLIKVYYEGRHKIIFYKNSFGYIYRSEFFHFLKGQKCIVSKNNPHSLKNIAIWLKLNNKTFKLAKGNIYTNSLKNRLKFKCNVCKNSFEMIWGNISQHQGCSKCKSSKGEKKNRIFLNK